MRDINRIDIYMDKLTKLWKKYPDLRFTQLLLNAFDGSDPSLYYMEDCKTFEKLDNAYAPVANGTTVFTGEGYSYDSDYGEKCELNFSINYIDSKATSCSVTGPHGSYGFDLDLLRRHMS